MSTPTRFPILILKARPSRPFPLLVLKARPGRKPTEGQSAFSFDEDAHPRAPKGGGGDKYKPGEFVPQTAHLTPSGDPGKLKQEASSMDQPVFTKTSGAGQKIEVRVVPTPEGPLLATSVDGKEIARSYDLSPLQVPKGDVTHYVSGRNNTNVGFRASEVETIQHALAAATAAHKETPEQKLKTLRSKRQSLAAEITGAHDDAQAAFDRVWARGDEGKAFSEKQRYTKQAEEAASRLAAFDAEHPELLEAIRTEKEESRKRFEATN